MPLNHDTTTDTTITEYYVEYLEPGFNNNEWVRRPKTFDSFKEAFDKIENLKSLISRPDIQYRIRFVQTRNFILWSTADGDE